MLENRQFPYSITAIEFSLKKCIHTPVSCTSHPAPSRAHLMLTSDTRLSGNAASHRAGLSP